MRGQLSVLAIEDSKEDAIILKSELQQAGFNPVLERVDSASALRQKLAEQRWDVLICDSSVPQLNAVAALEIVRQTHRNVPFFVVSGFIREQEAAAAIKAGARACISKDRLAELPAAIRQALAEGNEQSTSQEPVQPIPPGPDFQVLFEAAPGLYLVLAPDLKIIAVSNAYLRATKTKREQIVGRGIFDVFPDNPDDPAASGTRNLRLSLERVFQSGESDTMAVQKYDIRRPESEGGGFEERFWSPFNSPVMGPDGKILYIVHRVEDVTEFIRLKQRGVEQGKLTEQLKQRAHQMESEVYLRAQEVQESNRKLRNANDELGRLYDKAKELENLKSQFFANVSHELRTPLTLIIGPTEKLLASSQLSSNMRSTMEMIARNSRLLLKHVNDLLDVARLEAGKMEVLYVDTDLVRLVRLTAGYFDILARERHLTFAVDVPEKMPAQVDPEKFQRILLNLLANAFKFTPEGGRIRCLLRESAEEGMAVLEVADSGPGIPLEFRQAAFERFRQLQGGAARRFGGTGLGLAIVHDFVALHDGRVSIGDAPEGGALVTVTLPRRSPTDANVRQIEHVEPSDELVRQQVETLHQPAERATVSAAEDKPLVVVVEDNRDMSHFLAENLEVYYRVETASDGREGLSKIMASRPDVILTDVMMPEMSGDMLVQAVRAQRQFDTTPIIVLTAKADDELRIRLLRTGVQDYVTKPFSIEELRARIGNLVALKCGHDQIRKLNRELGTANKELEAFSYSVSHDLRAPLRAITSFSDMLASEISEHGKEKLETIRSNAARMERLITDQLRFSQLSRQPLEMETVDVSGLVNEVISDLCREHPGREIEIRIGSLPNCFGDLSLLRHVFINLLSNAFKFTRNKGPALIEVSSMRQNFEKIYFVRDNGVGFEMKEAERLFGVFQRLHRADEFDGTGVGLTIAQRIIQRHGGRIWAEAEVNKGAVFYFTLP